MAGVALMTLGGALGLALGARDTAVLCVAGVTGMVRAAQTHAHYHFTWQVWYKLISTVVLRGRCNTDNIGTLGGALGLQRGRHRTMYTAKGSDIRPGIPRAPRFLRDRRGTM